MSHPSTTGTPSSDAGEQRPLEGLVVIDLTKFVSGPYCTMLMADAGATVIKIEAPTGDNSRSGEPRFPTGGTQVGAPFLRMNRNKLSVALDLKSRSGKDALKRLIARADVLVENFRYGVLEKLGFDQSVLDEVNPGLIYCSISGFGHSETDLRSRPAFNLIAEYEAGVYNSSGPAGIPAPLGPYVGDLFPAMHALSGMLMALYRRSITGAGAHVDIAMFDAMLSLNESAGSNETWIDDPAAADLSNFYCPSGVFPCRDGFVCIDLVTDSQWKAFCSIIESPDLYAVPELSNGQQRSAHYEEFIAEPLLRWLSTHGADEATQILTAQSVPAAVVREPGEALLSKQSRQRDMAIEVGLDPVGDIAAAQPTGMKVAASPIRIDDLTSPAFAVVPEHGQHTVEVLRDFAGLTPEQITQTQSAH